jgi:SanA protein
MKRLFRKKTILRLLVVGILVMAGIIYFCNKKVNNAATGKIYTDVNAIPFNKVGLLLGTTRFLSGKRPNPYYNFRIEAAAELIRAGKIKYLIISGDNSRTDYDEPTDMRADLIRAGVDSTIIYLDYAGFRTFDSVVRAREIFGQDSITIISQFFHNQRAIFIASKEKISAIGFNARDVSGSNGFKVQLREKFARVKLFIDYLFGKKPKFLGPVIRIPD